MCWNWVDLERSDLLCDRPNSADKLIKLWTIPYCKKIYFAAEIHCKIILSLNK